MVSPESYRIDVLVDDTVVVEAKTVERLTPIHQAQVLTYLRLSGKEVGLLLNFWACPSKDGGIQRLVLSRDRAWGSFFPLPGESGMTFSKTGDAVTTLMVPIIQN